MTVNVTSRVLTAVLAFAGACDEIDGEPPSGGPPPPAPAVQDDPGEATANDSGGPQAATAKKLARYAECLYRTRPRVAASQARWKATVGEDGTPRGRRTLPQIIGIDAEERSVCDRIDRDGPTMAPTMAKLEGAAATYVDALAQLGPYTMKLQGYYAGERYDADDWAEGKALAASLRSALARFETAAAVFSTVVEAEQADSDAALIAAFRQSDDPGVMLPARETMVAARAWIDCVRSAKDSVAACDEQAAEVTTHASALERRRRADPAAAADVFWLTAYASSAQKLRDIAERLAAAGKLGRTGRTDRSRNKKRKQTGPPTPTRTQAQRAFHALALDYGELGA